MILSAKEAGADAVKFQIYFADELLVNSHSKYSHFKNQSFSINEWNNLFSKIKKISNPNKTTNNAC